MALYVARRPPLVTNQVFSVSVSDTLSSESVGDSFNRTVPAGTTWGTATVDGAYTAYSFNPGGNIYSVTPGFGQLVAPNGSGNQLFQTLAGSFTDTDATIQVTWDKTPSANYAAASLGIRTDSGGNGYWLTLFALSSGGVAMQLYSAGITTAGIPSETFPSVTGGLGDTFTLRVTATGTTITGKAWRTSDGESTATVQTATNSAHASGMVGVGATDAGTISNTPITVSYSNFVSRTPGLVNSDLVARGIHPTQPTDVGATITESLTRVVTRAVADTGRSGADTTATRRARPVTDTLTFTDSAAVTHTYTRTAADTGVTNTDTTAITKLRTLTASDTGVATTTSTITRGVTHAASDTLTFTDTVVGAHSYTRSASDTGVAISDSTAVTRLRSLAATDTGVTITEAFKRVVTHSVADTGATQTDSVARTSFRTVSDTGATITSSIGVAPARGVADTGVSLSEAIARAINRGVASTGATITDTVARLQTRGVTDTLTLSDTPTRVFTAARSTSDSGVTVSESIQRAVSRATSDTGATITSNVTRVKGPVVGVTDTLTITDSTTRLFVAGRAASDAGVTVTSSVSKQVTRSVTETGVAITSSVAVSRAAGRQATDTLVFTDSTTRSLIATRHPADTGLVLTDSVTGQRGAAYTITDTGLVLTDLVAARRVVAATLTDTGLTLTDSVLVASSIYATAEFTSTQSLVTYTTSLFIPTSAASEATNRYDSDVLNTGFTSDTSTEAEYDTTGVL
jgi:hypothetical protein